MTNALSRSVRTLAPIILGAAVLLAWQALVEEFGVPRILLPAPSDIAVALWRTAFELRQDWVQTIVRGAVPGFLIGSSAGFCIALIIDRWPIVSRGLVPLSALLAAMPIIGVAPIMVMWFGFDWQSKAAVVALMSFFPMVAMTGAGLGASETVLIDLLHSYGASYAQSLGYLRLPAALPYVFAALRVNAPSAVIGAMIAEFFGTPTYGLGFRMSSEIGRLGFAVVWAAILVATFSGLTLYGIVAVAERAFTFRHAFTRT